MSFTLTHHAADFPDHEVVATATPTGRFLITADDVTYRIVCADAFRDGDWLVLAIRQTKRGTDYVRTVGATTRTMSWLVPAVGIDATLPLQVRALVADLDAFLSANTPAVVPADGELQDDAPADVVIVDAPDDDDWLTVAVAVGATAAPAAPVAAPAPVWTPGRPEATAGALIALGAVFLILAVVFGWGVTAGAPAPSTSAVAADRDASRDEDSPRWDCYTDGNRLCAAFHGPTR